MDNTKQPSREALIVRNAHKVAHVLSVKLDSLVGVRRMPLTNGRMAFEFTNQGRSQGFAQSYVERDLAQLATRLHEAFKGTSHGDSKSNASHKGKRVRVS